MLYKQNFIRISLHSIHPTCPAHLTLLDLIALIIVIYHDHNYFHYPVILSQC
jgi:hypothetical protein